VFGGEGGEELLAVDFLGHVAKVASAADVPEFRAPMIPSA
jgi:hypothetical protein